VALRAPHRRAAPGVSRYGPQNPHARAATAGTGRGDFTTSAGGVQARHKSIGSQKMQRPAGCGPEADVEKKPHGDLPCQELQGMFA